MGFVVGHINYTSFPEQISKEKLDKLPTHRLLSHFKKFRAAYYHHTGKVIELFEYFQDLKDRLAKREHVERK